MPSDVTKNKGQKLASDDREKYCDSVEERSKNLQRLFTEMQANRERRGWDYDSQRALDSSHSRVRIEAEEKKCQFLAFEIQIAPL